MTKIAKLGGGRFQQADYLIGRYAAKPPSGTTLEDVMHPEYFQNELAQLRAGMLINVLSDDFALDCDIRVLTVTKTTATMRLVRLHDEATVKKVDVGEVSDVIVTWGGPQQKWRVIHNKEIIQHGFSSQPEAEAAAETYRQALKG